MVHLLNGTEQLFTQSRFTAHLHGSPLSHNDNNDTLAALQKIPTGVTESHIQRTTCEGQSHQVLGNLQRKHLVIFTITCKQIWGFF